MNHQATIGERIADALGDARGSYEQLICNNICAVLGVDPEFRGHLIPAPSISEATAAWLRNAAESSAADADHAMEILAALDLVEDLLPRS